MKFYGNNIIIEDARVCKIRTIFTDLLDFKQPKCPLTEIQLFNKAFL